MTDNPSRNLRILAHAMKQGSEAWLEARRSRVTGTDIGALLGVNPWKSEADVAAEKMGGPGVESTLRMRIGTALEDLIAREYEAETGYRLRRFPGLKVHPTIEWAAASPDWHVVGRRVIVETKWTGSRRRFEDGLPQDVEAQVMWQLGCVGWQHADVAVLIGGEELRRFPVEYDEAVFLWHGGGGEGLPRTAGCRGALRRIGRQHPPPLPGRRRQRDRGRRRRSRRRSPSCTACALRGATSRPPSTPSRWR